MSSGDYSGSIRLERLCRLSGPGIMEKSHCTIAVVISIKIEVSNKNEVQKHPGS